MANPDRAEGFRCVGSRFGGKIPAPRAYNIEGGITIAIGDPCALNSGGQVVLPTATVGALLGVVAPQAGITRLGTNLYTSSTTDADIMVYDDPDCLFEGQCSGTATSVMLGKLCDFEGTTGICEVNEDAATEKTLCIQKLVSGPHGSRGNVTVGANGVVHFTICRNTTAQQGPAL